MSKETPKHHTFLRNDASLNKTSEDNFLRWFADSPVLGQDGAPLVVYHGSQTPEGLSEFRIGGAQDSVLSGDAYGVGAYFTSSPREAGHYARETGAIFPVYITGKILNLNVENLDPVDAKKLTDLGRDLLLPSDKARFELGREVRLFGDRDDAREFFESQRANWLQFGDGMCRAEPEVLAADGKFAIEFTNFDADILIATGADATTLFKAIGWQNLRVAGYDGLMMNRSDGNIWVVMHNTEGKIKSSIGNNGLFDENCADITDRTSHRIDQLGAKPKTLLGDEAPLIQRRLSIIGDELALNGRSIRDNFSSWFGKSKVVNDVGEPLVVFHGSTRGGISASGAGTSYFSSSHDVANTYSQDDSYLCKGDESVVQAMYLKIENPLVVDAEGAAWMRIEFEGRRYTTDDLAGLARRRGYDGLIVKNLEDNVNDEDLSASDVYVTLGKKAQIKSAIGHPGLFDGSCNDISDVRSMRALVEAKSAEDALRYIATSVNQKARYVP